MGFLRFGVLCTNCVTHGQSVVSLSSLLPAQPPPGRGRARNFLGFGGLGFRV